MLVNHLIQITITLVAGTNTVVSCDAFGMLQVLNPFRFGMYDQDVKRQAEPVTSIKGHRIPRRTRNSKTTSSTGMPTRSCQRDFSVSDQTSSNIIWSLQTPFFLQGKHDLSDKFMIQFGLLTLKNTTLFITVGGKQLAVDNMVTINTV